MQTFIALLRGINVGGHKKIKMAELRELCRSMGLERATTLLQSGNLVFRAHRAKKDALAVRLADEIEASFGFRCEVLVIEPRELRTVIDAMPFDTETLEASRLVVVFLDRSPSAPMRKHLEERCEGPEELAFGKRQLYVYYPQGSGRSKFTLTIMEKALGATGTARNWNTTRKLLDVASQVEQG